MRSRIGESLRAARTRAGWSREALAYHSGVSWSAIAQIESGRRQDIRLSSLTALAEALGVSVDYLVGSTATLAPHLFEHRLLEYGSDEEYLATTIPFIEDGLERSECLLVVTTKAQTALVRDALDVRSEDVEFATSTEWYSSLSAALNRYRAFVKQKFDAGAAWIRVVGDPVWAGRSVADNTAWFRYESLVNLAFAAAPATIVCTYDTRSASAEVIADARRTHPHVTHAGVTHAHVTYPGVSSEHGATGDPTYQEPEDFLLQP